MCKQMIISNEIIGCTWVQSYGSTTKYSDIIDINKINVVCYLQSSCSEHWSFTPRLEARKRSDSTWTSLKTLNRVEATTVPVDGTIYDALRVVNNYNSTSGNTYSAMIAVKVVKFS